jgi:hypothetical protein
MRSYGIAAFSVAGLKRSVSVLATCNRNMLMLMSTSLVHTSYRGVAHPMVSYKGRGAMWLTKWFVVTFSVPYLKRNTASHL